MGVVIKDKVYELPEEGIQSVTITEIQDLGLTETKFGMKDRVRIVLQTDETDSEGNPINVFVTATKSLHQKSALRGFLNQLGVNPGSEFDLEDLIGIKTQVVVQHNTSTNGKTYANVTSVVPKKKGKAEKAAPISDEDIPF